MEFIQSFRRYETKYLLDPEKYSRLLSETGNMLLRDSYGEYSICNIYLDTDDNYFIEHSLDRPSYKEKLRLRSYGNVTDSGNVFFEIKKKVCGVVYKRRIIIPLEQAENYVANGIRPPCLESFRDCQIFSEIDYLMNKYRPSPKLYLAYDRQAYFFTDRPELRVTFDRNIRSRSESLTLSSDERVSLLDTGIENYRLMEIKSSGAIPTELAAVLSKLKIYPVSFSKYGKIYESMRTDDKRKEIYI
ncbi:MAG: VTC domain-containing protein [Oscillospiraceae bacterium]